MGYVGKSQRKEYTSGRPDLTPLPFYDLLPADCIAKVVKASGGTRLCTKKDSYATTSSEDRVDEEIQPLDSYCTQYQKHYANDADELERYGLFKKSKSNVPKLNALNPEPVFGITSMSKRSELEQEVSNWSSMCDKVVCWCDRIRKKHKKLTLGDLIPADCVGREIWTRPR